MTRLCERLDARACNKRLRHPYLSYTEALRRSCHVEHRSSSAPAPTPGFLRPSTVTCGAPLKVTGGFPELVLRARASRFDPEREARRPSPADDGELSSSRCLRLFPTTRKVRAEGCSASTARPCHEQYAIAHAAPHSRPSGGVPRTSPYPPKAAGQPRVGAPRARLMIIIPLQGCDLRRRFRRKDSNAGRRRVGR